MTELQQLVIVLYTYRYTVTNKMGGDKNTAANYRINQTSNLKSIPKLKKCTDTSSMTGRAQKVQSSCRSTTRICRGMWEHASGQSVPRTVFAPHRFCTYANQLALFFLFITKNGHSFACELKLERNTKTQKHLFAGHFDTSVHILNHLNPQVFIQCQ